MDRRQALLALLALISTMTLHSEKAEAEDSEEKPALWDNFGDMLRDMRSHARATGDSFHPMDDPLRRCIGYAAFGASDEEISRSWEISLTKLKTVHEIEESDPELWAWMGGSDCLRSAAGRHGLAAKCSAVRDGV